MKRISIERLLNLKKELREINRLELSEIVWLKDGKVLDIPQKIIDDFKFIGLGNVDFITSGYYKGRSEQF